MKARHALAALSVLLVGALLWTAWPRPPSECALGEILQIPPPGGAPAEVIASQLAETSAPMESRVRATASEAAPIASPDSVPAPTVALHGHVRDRDSGAPIAGAVLEFKQFAATTDPDGAFRLENLITSRSFPQLTVRADGYPTTKELVWFHESTDMELEIQLARGNVTLHVAVVDRDTGERVVDPQLTSPSRVVIGAADVDGRFAISVTEGDDVAIEVRADGYCGFSWRWRVARPESNDRVTIPLVRDASIEGTVRNASQQPIAGAGVSVRCVASRSGRLMLSPEERSRYGLSGDTNYISADAASKTDENGRFRLPAMPCEGDSELSVFARSYAPQKRMLAVRDAGSAVLADVTLERGATIRVRALKNGAPWKGWVSSGCRELGYHDEPAIQDGEFVFTGVPRGLIVIQLTKPGTKVAEQEATLRITDEGEYRQDFEWQEEPATIAGRVVNPAGKPVSDARVDAHGVFPSGREIAAAAASAHDGTFVIDVVAGASYDVAAMHNRVSSVRAVREGITAGSKDVEIVLADIGRIRLKLIDEATGDWARLAKPSGQFPLCWRRSGTEEFTSFQSFRGGNNDITLELPTGSLDLVLNLQSEGFLPWRISSYPLTAGKTQELEARLARGVEARIALVAAAGEPPSRLTEHLFFCVEASQLDLLQGPFADRDERSNHRINGIEMRLHDPALLHQVLSLDESGVAFLHGLAPGKYALRAFPPDFDIEPAFVKVAPGGRADLEFRWRSHE